MFLSACAADERWDLSPEKTHHHFEKVGLDFCSKKLIPFASCMGYLCTFIINSMPNVGEYFILMEHLGILSKQSFLATRWVSVTFWRLRGSNSTG